MLQLRHYFSYMEKKATLKLVPVFTGSGRHYLRSSDVALCWYLLLCMCNELQYVQEPEPNSVLNNTEQLFNSVNSNTPLVCSVKEQLTSYSSPSTSYSSFFSFIILSFLSSLAPTRFVLANEVLTPTREMQYRTCFYFLLYFSFSKLVFLFGLWFLSLFF